MCEQERQRRSAPDPSIWIQDPLGHGHTLGWCLNVLPANTAMTVNSRFAQELLLRVISKDKRTLMSMTGWPWTLFMLDFVQVMVVRVRTFSLMISAWWRRRISYQRQNTRQKSCMSLIPNSGSGTLSFWLLVLTFDTKYASESRQTKKLPGWAVKSLPLYRKENSVPEQNLRETRGLAGKAVGVLALAHGVVALPPRRLSEAC